MGRGIVQARIIGPLGQDIADRLAGHSLPAYQVATAPLDPELARSLFPRGTIIDQTPPPDTVVSQESRISLTVSARSVSAEPELEYHVRYDAPQSGVQRHIRIVSVSKSGDKEIFNGLRDPGSKIDLTIPFGSADKIRIFVNGILVEERPVK